VTVFPGRVFMHVPYDPTNGTVSWGDVRRSQSDPEGRTKSAL
jgi:hypothetical protein